MRLSLPCNIRMRWAFSGNSCLIFSTWSSVVVILALRTKWHHISSTRTVPLGHSIMPKAIPFLGRWIPCNQIESSSALFYLQWHGRNRCLFLNQCLAICRCVPPVDLQYTPDPKILLAVASINAARASLHSSDPTNTPSWQFWSCRRA